MKSREIAATYAEALYALGREEEMLDELEADYRMVVTIINEHRDLLRLFIHPLISDQAKDEVIENIFPRLSEYLRNFLSLLVRRKRAEYITLIYDELLKVRAEQEGVSYVTIYSSRRLSTEEQHRIEMRLAKVIRRAVVSQVVVEPSLLGGVKIEYEGRVIDGSLQRRLQQLGYSISSSRKGG
ncbi:ATP synthase F1 subunit delta [Candidatus Acetothermia bacterium]|jgi:F-type H+-transporting ATPase subunit delta|nr:ATP synthase F1 subunit delta [Candidatus Acetothermia bacterium]MCI2426033.1 ATP synthase F1 subunit delta [Candidatus Acetothermia bacterium]MCI2427715.1 ATP synthase F1 subunit delta [Candidatus Acetothermia bacterium]MCI2428990.1 ATP synthase F1 subunit delta [Candidatus Acetothermia bacterium]